MSYFEELSAAQKDAFLDAHAFFSDTASERIFAKIIPSISSLQSWLEYYVLTDRFGQLVSDFFSEAVNDAILSYSFARVGTWRPALQSLRSTIENVLFFLYYKDHPIELALWHKQKHRIGFTHLCQYLRAHPFLSERDHQSETGIDDVEKAYARLSQAVHGSVEHFRMVKKSGTGKLPSVHVKSVPELSRYRSMTKEVIGALNLLLVATFSQDLQGTSLPTLRSGIGGALSAHAKNTCKGVFKVVLH